MTVGDLIWRRIVEVAACDGGRGALGREIEEWVEFRFGAAEDPSGRAAFRAYLRGLADAAIYLRRGVLPAGPEWPDGGG